MHNCILKKILSVHSLARQGMRAIASSDGFKEGTLAF